MTNEKAAAKETARKASDEAVQAVKQRKPERRILPPATYPLINQLRLAQHHILSTPYYDTLCILVTKTSKNKCCRLNRVSLATQVTVFEQTFGHTDSNFVETLGLLNTQHLLTSLHRKNLRTKKNEDFQRQAEQEKKVRGG